MTIVAPGITLLVEGNCTMANIEERTAKDGETSYRVLIRLKGHPAVSATFKGKTKAKKWASDTESAIRDGRYFKTSEAARHTFAEMIDRYLADVMPRKSERQQQLQTVQLGWWKDELGPITLDKLTPAVIVEKRDLLARKPVPGFETDGETPRMRSAGSVNRHLAALGHVLTIAVNEWAWLDDSPMRKVSKLKEARGRVRFLSDDERKKLLQTCKESKDSHLYPLVVVALSTGARQGELLGLHWSEVELERGVVVFLDTKNGERRAAPLAGHALDQVKELTKVRRIDDDRVFPMTPGGLRWFFEKAVKSASIEDFRFHDLRHSAASYLAMNGATLAEIAEVLGHKTLAMVKRYSHLTEQHTSKVVSKMNAAIFGGE
ncbi:MAG: site-specific integrase [Thermoanaerobaculales bacterium]|nr:site-specific integrase [Thermoanaerobaculales bacterium]